jgi:hypothetical protein
MADEVVLNNYSDDSQIKTYINSELMPRVFKNIPLNLLNVGEIGIINEYLSQALENQAFTSSFYFNESFITKAVLPSSIFAEAAIFNLGYSFATPSSCNILLELSLDDIYRNAEFNSTSGLYEFILDKNTVINLKDNGNTYSLDYDILIQYRNVETSNDKASIPAWNCQYTNMDELNVCATNKDRYITYRVTSKWLCLFLNVNEYVREKHVVVNNSSLGIANTDTVISCTNHICGFDVKFIDADGTAQWIPHDHLLPMHANVNDQNPYLHYIMDNPQTIRFMFQLDGSKYFTPSIGSQYEIYIYTCHGEPANFTAWDNEESQPSVIATTSRYSNNGNVLKACFVLAGGSLGGTNIGTVETTRRETIQAYNTAHVLSTDHDIDEWFKTFYFKNVLYPYFFKRRDDPWGRIWSGYLALKDDDDYVYRTNTLHARIPYEILYKNNDNTVSSNEIIIPPGWLWVYNDRSDRMTVIPVTKTKSKKVEHANAKTSVAEKFVFANPFGIRIQKDPFAVGYFNPWINQYLTTTNTGYVNENPVEKTDKVLLYHASAVFSDIKRVYKSDYYNFETYILPTIDQWGTANTRMVQYLRGGLMEPLFNEAIWDYFNEPKDKFAQHIPVYARNEDEDGYLPYDKTKTYFCVQRKEQYTDSKKWKLYNIWIEDTSNLSETKQTYLTITGNIDGVEGSDEIWGNDGICKDYAVYSTGVTDISIYPTEVLDKGLTFGRVQYQNYYRLTLADNATYGLIDEIYVTSATLTDETGYGENRLYRIGNKYDDDVNLNIHFHDGSTQTVTIRNAAVVYTPYTCQYDDTSKLYRIDMRNVDANDVVIYAEMRPSADSGSVEYYRIPFSEIGDNVPFFDVANSQLPTDKNNMRVVLTAYMNGTAVGYIEMQPVSKEEDGSYKFDAKMYPLNELIDIDDRIRIASTVIGGGSWIPLNGASAITLDASNPDLRISILMRAETADYGTEVQNDPNFEQFRIVDEYKVDSFELVQELKEMRSVVDFSEGSIPTEEQVNNYNDFLGLHDPMSASNDIYTIYKYADTRHRGSGILIPYDEIISCALKMYQLYTSYEVTYEDIISPTIPEELTVIGNILKSISEDTTQGDKLDWAYIAYNLQNYPEYINEAFDNTSVNNGVTIQLMPFVESKLMMNDRFENFVGAFVNVHKSIEPVIFSRLDGNHYLDCKLIATYGLPHTFCTDTEKLKDPVQTNFWPNLSIQISFDVRFVNPSLATNTTDELKTIVKSYFNKLTTLHSPSDRVDMNNNIYISRLIREMSIHDNVEYLKFNGFYTDDKSNPKGDYMDANVQAIVQRWDTLEDFPKYSSNGQMISELENFVPEMFILEDDNIVINSI